MKKTAVTAVFSFMLYTSTYEYEYSSAVLSHDVNSSFGRNNVPYFPSVYSCLGARRSVLRSVTAVVQKSSPTNERVAWASGARNYDNFGYMYFNTAHLYYSTDNR